MHGLDPPAQHRAAMVFGRLLAEGRLSEAECLPALLAAATRASPGTDASGMRMRLVHRLRDSARDWAAAREQAARAVQAAIAPLLARWATPEAILRAAAKANDGVLAAEEVAALAAGAAQRALRQLALRRG
ncbi:MAG: hypothetical protein JO264_19385 [Acidisphaera sp.]|nr:hypothetical protein [Acidisphaera sp.]